MRILQNCRNAIAVLLLVPMLAFGQGVAPVHPTKPNGSALFPTAFASADNIAAQTATALHGLTYIWDGANWDRWTGAVTQSGTWNIGTLTTITNPVAVTGTFWQATQPVSGTTFDGILRDGTGDTTQANVSSGRLHVDGSGVTQPVSGTFWQATQPISAASLPLPTGAATSANQDGIIKDGAGDTTQANVSSGRLHVDGSGVTQPVSGTVTVTDGAGALNIICDSGCGGAASFEDNDAFVADTTPVNILGALYDTTPPAVTDGNAGAVRMNSSRALMVDGSGVTQPVSGTFWQATQPVSGTVALSNSFLLDATYTGRMPAGASPADNESNTNAALSRIGTFAYVYDGAAWDRWTGLVQAAQSGTWNITNISGTVSLPTGASTLSEQQTQTTSLQKIDNAVYTDNAAISEVAAIGCQFDDTTPGTVTENNVRAVRCSTRREVYGQIRDAAGNERGVNVNASNEMLTSASITALPNEGQQTAANSISVTPDTDNDPIGATGAAPPGEATFVGGLTSGATGGFLTGFAVCDSFANVNVSTATTTLLVTGVSGRHVRICSLSLVTAAANNVALISGTGATCGTGTTGMSGGTTSSAGWNFAANGGITQGSGLGAINQTNATGDSVCVVTSATTQLSGRLSYAIY